MSNISSMQDSSGRKTYDLELLGKLLARRKSRRYLGAALSLVEMFGGAVDQDRKARRK
jgi:hypothetical protein